MKKNLEEMQVKVANKRAILESHDGEEFSPITVAKNVLTDDGTTMQDYFDNHSEPNISTKIVNSNSMSKVGQGDNVDFSDNVMNGAYEDVVLKGKSLVNVIQEPSSQDVVLPYAFEEGERVTINDTHSNGCVEVEVKGRTLVNLVPTRAIDYIATSDYDGVNFLGQPSNGGGHSWKVIHDLKPNTKYFISCYVETFDVTEGQYYLLNNPASSSVFSESMRIESTGFYKWILTSQTELTEDISIVLRCQNGNARGAIKIKNIMIIEYQEGMENWDIPYFEGMQSVKMPILTTTGKNLIENLPRLSANGISIQPTNNPTQVVVNGTVTNITDYYVAEVKTNNNSHIFNIEVGESLTLSNSLGKKCYFGQDKNGITEWTSPSLTKKDGGTNLRCFIRFNQGDSFDNEIMTVQIEQGLIATPYEQHKSSILSLPEEVVLGGLGNTRDTFNTTTGKYTKRTDTMTVTNYKNSLGSSVVEGAWSIVVTPPNKKWQTTTLCVSDKFSMGGGHSNRDCGFYENPANFVFFDKTVNSADEFIAKYGDFSFTYILKTPVVTKINLSSTLKSWNTTTHIYSEIPENTLYPILSHSNPSYPVILKPSTKYSIVANSYSNDHTNSAINFNLGGATASTVVGNRVTTITTPSTLSNELLTMSGRGNKLNNVMVIEGDVVGDEPYFEGICDSKSPILLNCGKNLAKLTRSYTSFGLTFKVIDDTLYVDGTAERILDYYLTTNNCENSKMLNSLEVGTMVTLSNSLGLRNFFGVWRNGTTDDSWFSNTMTIQNGDNNIRCFIRFDQGSTYNNQAIKIQLEATQNPTTYEPYKSNTTTFEQKDDKTIVLRSLPNGVCDTLNVNTGEYVQNIGERTFDGSEDELFGSHSSQNINKPLYRYICDISDMKIISEHTDNTHLYCDKWATVQDKDDTSIGRWSTAPNVHRRIAHDRGALYFVVEGKSDVTQFREYLSQNPITVQYELATPIVKQINVEGYPYAYENGHILLESGSQEQSLTPTIEYSIVANRGGQIRSNQRMVERHQKKLDSLYATTLVNMIDSQYKQVLMKLKSELGSEVRTWDIE